MAERSHSLGIGELAESLRSAFLSYHQHGKESLRECASLVSACFQRPHYLPDIVWRAGALVLQERKNLVQLEHFFNAILRLFPQNKEEIKLESALYTALSGDIAKATEMLLRVEGIFPYCENALIHGYCGLYQALLWERSGGSADELLLDRAIDHMMQAISIDPDLDLFLYRSVELLERRNRASEADALLRSHMSKDPTNPNKFKIYYSFISRQTPHDYHNRLDLLAQIALLDPCAAVLRDVGPLLSSARRKGLANDRLEIFAMSVLGAVVECPGFQRRVDLWQQYSKLLVTISPRLLPCTSDFARSLPCWQGRLGWWQRGLFGHLQPLSSGSAGMALDHAKAVCAARIYGRDNPFTACLVQRLESHEVPLCPELTAILAGLPPAPVPNDPVKREVEELGDAVGEGEESESGEDKAGKGDVAAQVKEEESDEPHEAAVALSPLPTASALPSWPARGAAAAVSVSGRSKASSQHSFPLSPLLPLGEDFTRDSPSPLGTSFFPPPRSAASLPGSDRFQSLPHPDDEDEDRETTQSRSTRRRSKRHGSTFDDEDDEGDGERRSRRGRDEEEEGAITWGGSSQTSRRKSSKHSRRSRHDDDDDVELDWD
eukprot:m.57129 g.57129  ORF g.57129 m.57129 type:complete len:605 (-) comp12087_c0_seq2:25-1839(-)